jgi:hypothetical protein
MKQQVIINFDNPEAALYFMEWLSNSGEQAYFDAAACQDSESIMPDTIRYRMKKFVIDVEHDLEPR